MNLIPMPKKLTLEPGSFSLQGAAIVLEDGCDCRLAYHAAHLKNSLGVDSALCAGAPKDGAIALSHGEKGDAYTLHISPERVTIRGDGPAGAFYGLMTLRQLMTQYGEELPCLRISDRPDFSDRGFYHDISRGRVPTLTQLKHIVEELAQFKVNCLELYVESNYEFTECRQITAPENRLTAQELLALDDYCHLYFIELVPSLSTFGHLYDLLQSEQYRSLCELEDYQPSNHYWMEKMDHHTIDVSNPESLRLLCSLIDQYLPLFRSNRFNICCDETFDLCKGRNRGKDSAEEYVKFVSKLITHLKSHGKTVQMWGDIVLKHPEKVALLPADTVMLNWCYMKEPVEKNVRFFAGSGHPQVVCPGTSAWNRFVEEIDRSTGNITKMAKYGYENGAVGLLNTNWGDFGAICGWNCQQFGVALGAEKGWNALGEPGEAFDRAASALLYGQAEVNVIQLIRELGECERTAEWAQLVPWYSAKLRGEEAALAADLPQIQAHIGECEALLKQLRDLGGDARFTDLGLAAQAILLLNKTVLLLNGKVGFGRDELQRAWEAWIPAYESAWLRDNKPSQLSRVTQFIRDLL